MRSRELRPFRVELKNKRRSIPAPPPSIWGDTAKLFEAAPDGAIAPLLFKKHEPVVAPAPLCTEPAGEAQPRRVLPDLRSTQTEVAEDAVAIRVKQRRIHEHSGDERRQHQQQPESREKAVVSAAVGGDGLLEEPTTYAWSVTTPVEVNKPIVAARNPASVLADTPIIVPQIAQRRDRKWVRAIEDLPRSERWRRRLPDVCR